MATSSVPDTPPARADARRNRAQVLRAAQRAFAESGTGVSLGEVARLAGVGAGTVYRHFPRKEDLTEAVLSQRIERLSRLAAEHAASDDPGAAFFGYFADVVISGAKSRDLCEILDAEDGWPNTILVAAQRRLATAVDELLNAARSAGAVRADVTAEDVLALIGGCVVMQRGQSDSDVLRKPCLLVLDMLRADGVTKAGKEPRERDVTVVPIRHEGPHCALCGQPAPTGGLGRPARYCRPACRQKAYRQRRDTGK